MAQESSAAMKRMPGPLADLLKKAGEGAKDPQASFARDFGGGEQMADPTAGSAVIPIPSAARAEAQVAKRVRMKDVRISAPKEAVGILTKKTYRLRPDQYVTLAMLEAKLLETRHVRIGASKLAREAFDLLFARHKRLLGGSSPDELRKTEATR